MEILQNGFIFFANFAETIKQFPEEKQAHAYQALCEYGIYGILPEDESLRIMCLMAKSSIFKEDKRKNNGGNHNPEGKNQYSKEVNSGQSCSILVNSGQSGQFLYKEKEKEKEKGEEEKKEKEKIKEKIKVFIPPTLDECKQYAKELHCFSILGKDFYNYYTLGDWKDKTGKQIKNWKQKMFQWYMHDKEKYYNDIPEPPKITKEEMENFKRAEPLRVIEGGDDADN